jgi:hypothetical protein
MWEMRTIVMGMLGALGKMNWTSSNLLRRRQFSARKILQYISMYARKQNGKTRTILPRYHRGRERR